MASRSVGLAVSLILFVMIYRFCSGAKSITYYVDEPCPKLRDFKPFELEQWWGRRLFTHITNSVNSNS